jgi:hypothetical protein
MARKKAKATIMFLKRAPSSRQRSGTSNSPTANADGKLSKNLMIARERYILDA